MLRKIGQSRDDLFNQNAGIAHKVVEASWYKELSETNTKKLD